LPFLYDVDSLLPKNRGEAPLRGSPHGLVVII